MSFILKIVEGPNRGAEIALPDGVAVTLGKGEDCDIVLADATLPETPLPIEASASGVTVGGEALAPFSVKTFGATSFAVGPADKAWQALKWPERKPSKVEGQRPKDDGERPKVEGREAEEAVRADTEAQRQGSDFEPEKEKKKRRGCGCGCLVALLLMLAILAALCWIFRDRDEVKPWLDRAKPYAERAVSWVSDRTQSGEPNPGTGDTPADLQPSDLRPSTPLMALAGRYGLATTNRAGRAVLVGDFETRAERLKATAEAYAAQPGVELDFADDESLKTAAEDTLAMLSERGLRVVAATNRVVALSGSPADLLRTLDALAADLPKLRDVDVSGIVSHRGTEETGTQSLKEAADSHNGIGLRASVASASLRDRKSPSLPVCGILTTPYPCLVLKSGARVMEGAPFGEWTVAKIAADSVTLTNAERSVTWKP